jgi:AcrR family transcriptional regulator
MKSRAGKTNNMHEVVDRIVRVALDEFNENSYEGATMRSIARRAGISLATIYKCFDSKQKLAVHLGNDIDDLMHTELQRQLGGVKGVENKIRKMTWFFLHYFETNDKYAWLAYITLNPVYFEILKEHHMTRRQTELFESILREGQQQGIVRQDVDIIAARRMYFSLIREIVIVWLYAKRGGHNYSLMDYVERIIDLTMAAVRVQPHNMPTNCPYATR